VFPQFVSGYGIVGLKSMNAAYSRDVLAYGFWAASF